MIRTMLVAAFWMLTLKVYACEACGCSSAMGFDLSFNLKTNSISLVYNRNAFASNLNRPVELQDGFNTVSLQLRYYLKPGLSVIAALPYHVNQRNHVDFRQKIAGMGDVRIGMLYQLANTDGPSLKFFAEGGLGLKFPSGHYNKDLHDEELPENFNLGNGSFGLMGMVNFVLTRSNWTMSINESYLYHFDSASGYHYGNQNLFQVNVGRLINLNKDVVIIPGLGLMSEVIGKDTYAAGTEVNHSGGQGLYGNFILGLRHKSWYWGAGYAPNLYSDYSAHEVKARYRMSMQLNYFFN